MDNFENSRTWKKTLGCQVDDTDIKKNIEMLRNAYFSIRNKAEYLAGEIASTVPNYTVHDISHIDALWEATDLILPDDFDLNPAEGFVLGVTFLIHDLGMGLTAYINGMDDIKELDIWKDTVTSEFRKRYGRDIRKKDWETLNTEIAHLAQENTLRKLHAIQAAKIPLLQWDFNGKKEYLIDDTLLREAYGYIIGEVAYSHWWNISKVKKEFQDRTLGALSNFPLNWTIDVIKLACILRVADAIQIDDRRSPVFLMKLRRPDKISKIHWVFQNKLYQPLINNCRIIYTSKSAFSIEEMNAWWVCYDTLKMIDKELWTVDTLLIETKHQQFTAMGVGGILSASELSRLILVENWMPVDTHIRVGNVGKLVSNLGGNQLYGNNILVPLRELIQNGSDAVRARRLLECDDKYIGDIIISIYNENNKIIIQIEDNGIGMSQNVLVGPFLDFGQSFWNTELMYDELPGLASTGFSSTGEYGIGFYSVFMWSNDVTVITKKYDLARDDTFVLEFKNGTNDRPILRKANKNEQIKDGGTIIKIIVNNNILTSIKNSSHQKEELDQIITKLCPCMDCNLWLNIGKKILLEKANDWMVIPPVELIKRLFGKKAYEEHMQKTKYDLDNLANNMQIIQKDNVVYGRALIGPEGMGVYNSSGGVVSLGGFAATSLSGIMGVLIGKSTRASREGAIPIIDRELLKGWVENQRQLIVDMKLNDKLQMDLSTIIRAFGIKPLELCIAENGKGYLNYNDIYNLVKQESCSEYILVQDAAIHNFTRNLTKESQVQYHSNVIWCSMGYLTILQSSLPLSNAFLWPLNSIKELNDSSIKNIVIQAIFDGWGVGITDRDGLILESDDEKQYSAVIGEVDGKIIEMNHITKVCRNKCIEG